MKGEKIIFVCRECGATSPKWLGRCPECESWNTFEEELLSDNKTKKSQKIAIKNKAEKEKRLPSAKGNQAV